MAAMVYSNFLSAEFVLGVSYEFISFVVHFRWWGRPPLKT